MPNKSILATIARDGTGEFTEKRSRFLCTIRRVTTMEMAQDVIAEVRQRDWDGRHHCTAVVLGAHGETTRSSDDGEPAGTAGAPMLAALQGSGVSDAVAVVTRWFGGVLLGTGGLVRAYSRAVSLAIDSVGIVERTEMLRAELQVPAADAGRVENSLRQWLAQNSGQVGEVDYGNQATFSLLIRPADTESFSRWSAQMSLAKPTFLDTVITELR